MKFSKELLCEILEEGGAICCIEYPRYNQRLRVAFRCSCGKETSKRFEMLNLYRLPYCEECSLKKATERSKATLIKNHGVDNAGKSKIIQEKIHNIFQEKYGMHPKKTKEVQDKWAATCLEKYGGHHNQNVEVQKKSEATSFHYKDYMLPSGNLVKYQGYENLALDELVQVYEEEDLGIGRSNVPSVDYYIDSKKHVYFPDFFVKLENKIIEVKSVWTIGLARGNIEEKAQATIKAGYKYEIWVYSDKKVKVEKKVY